MQEKNKYLEFMQLFVIGGILGFIYEELFYLIDLGKIVKRGITYGPWIPIYAFGSIFIILICIKHKDKPLIVLTLGGAISGLIEFISGYILHHVFHLRLWDYNHEILNFGNIGGYICLRSVLLFSICSLLLVYIIWPILNKINAKKIKYFDIITIIIFIIFILDIIISCIF